MFGYIIINKPEMKVKEFDTYRSYYCGLCRNLRDQYGLKGQMTLSFDMTFLILFLTGLYEPDTRFDQTTCIAHPFEKHPTSINEITSYVADMNMMLSYYKAMDDWKDERKITSRTFAALLRKEQADIEKKYPRKARKVSSYLEKIHLCEADNEENIDLISGYFGEIMAELFAYKIDEWEASLRKIGFYLGKFIYLMDAYEDIEKDLKEKNYNPFLNRYEEEDFQENCRMILTMMMAECSKEFEKLPIIQHVEILRNIIYSGVWCRFETVSKNRKDLKDNV